jgi:hypothetical protein
VLGNYRELALCGEQGLMDVEVEDAKLLHVDGQGYLTQEHAGCKPVVVVKLLMYEIS